MTLVNIRKKSTFFLHFLQEIGFSKIFAMTQFFVASYLKKFCEMFILLLVDGFLVGFSKFQFFTVATIPI
jgi:hypothetical protein